jgi:hypothetical protein
MIPFDRSRLQLAPLDQREHLLDISCILPLAKSARVHPNLKAVASRLRRATVQGSARVLMIGAHVLRSGLQRYLIDMMEHGLITCLAMNGACVIHDFEFAFAGATTESVAKYVSEGRFGLWRETGTINDIVTEAAPLDMGLGEAVGRFILERGLPHKELSVLAAAYRLGIPATVHVGIGYDITHEHPNFDGAAYGKTSAVDFLGFVHALESLEGGVVMNFGSAVMAPEIYLKALAMVRNVAHQENRQVARFTTLVCDLARLPADYRTEASRQNPGYFFRPWKTMLVRTVADGGESFYVRGNHADTLPALWTALNGGIVEVDAKK